MVPVKYVLKAVLPSKMKIVLFYQMIWTISLIWIFPIPN